MKIVSFNIRCDFGQDGGQNFSFRKGGILKKISQEKPDIIGFQEVLPHISEWLRDNLSDYIVVGCGRSEDLKDESMTLALKKETVQLLGLEVFWLSPTPYISGSRYDEQSICPRTCADAWVKYSGFDKPIRIYNTHLDHEGEAARRLGLQQILNRIKEDNERMAFPCILMGDFNAEPDSPELSALKTHTNPHLTDAAENLGITYHEYGNLKASCKIDYVLLDDNFKCSKAYLWNECNDGIYLSDHYPVCAEIELK